MGGLLGWPRVLALLLALSFAPPSIGLVRNGTARAAVEVQGAAAVGFGRLLASGALSSTATGDESDGPFFAVGNESCPETATPVMDLYDCVDAGTMTKAFSLGPIVCDFGRRWGGRCVVQVQDPALPAGCFVRVDASTFTSQLLYNPAGEGSGCPAPYVCNMLCKRHMTHPVASTTSTASPTSALSAPSLSSSSAALTGPTAAVTAMAALPKAASKPEKQPVPVPSTRCDAVCENFGFQSVDCGCFEYGESVWWACLRRAGDWLPGLVSCSTSCGECVALW